MESKCCKKCGCELPNDSKGRLCNSCGARKKAMIMVCVDWGLSALAAIGTTIGLSKVIKRGK